VDHPPLGTAAVAGFAKERLVSDDIIDLITADHREVEQLFGQLDSAGDQDAVIRRIADELIPHSKAEEQVVYPAIASAASDADDEVKDGTAEHHHIEEMLQQLLENGADAPGSDGILAAVVAETKHHVEEEETDILPAYRENSTPDERADLGRRFAEAKQRARAGGASSGAGGSSSGKTRDELYEEARRAGVEGRSSMTKDELAKALDEQ
jgi:hemerythrin-like domain-containing protein